MASQRTHDVVATVGTYKKDGEEKKRYANCGSAFTDDQGRISIKLDTIPVSPDWSGFLSLYPVENNRQHPQAERPRQQQRTQSQPPMENDDIPF